MGYFSHLARHLSERLVLLGEVCGSVDGDGGLAGRRYQHERLGAGHLQRLAGGAPEGRWKITFKKYADAITSRHMTQTTSNGKKLEGRRNEATVREMKGRQECKAGRNEERNEYSLVKL